MGQGSGSLRGPKAEEGDDVKRQVDSDDNFQKPIYQLVNVKNGSGKLIDIIKSSTTRHSRSGSLGLNKSLDFTASNKHADISVDRQIFELVEPLLYNGGRGKLMPLGLIWKARLGKLDSGDVDEVACDSLDGIEDSRDGEESLGYRRVCWKLEERGFVGETALHICFLLSTPTHMILAQKLLHMFPLLINDIYTCDEYFGESSLHMAIVNENVRIVKLLLDHGASVHERCLGSFFLPGDQKDKANGVIRSRFERWISKENGMRESQKDFLDHELGHLDLSSNHFNSLSTNYEGYVYWGEYPLSFAACLGLADCYKLLLAKGANSNMQDSNGNTTLHMTVIANRIDMFNLCYSNGANLDIANKQNLTPLTLAAKLRRVEMFFHILTTQRQVNWIFCNVGFVEDPLNGVDSINIDDGSCNDHSVLSIVVFEGSNEHLQMLDGLLSQLLRIKWETMARSKFYGWLIQFLLFLAVSVVSYITRLDKRGRRTSKVELSDYTNYQTVNFYSECLIVLYVIWFLLISIKRLIASVGIKASMKTLAQAPEVSMFIFTCLLILTCIPLRLLDWTQTEDFLVAIIMFIMPLKLLFFCRASRSVGSFIVMIYKILVNDVLCFVVFLMIFVAGFSQSFLIIFKTHQKSIKSSATESDNNYFTNLFDGVISMHMMALNEFSIVFDEFENTSYSVLAKLLFCAYMIIASILLINMLIAMLGKTYQDIASQPNESLRQWARALLIVERMWTPTERMKMLNRYSSLRSNIRYYNSTWSLTQKDKDEIDFLKKLKEENRKEAVRLGRMDSKSQY